jgi:cytosine/adenosine deaminase-related metal-dependent hydrolase
MDKREILFANARLPDGSTVDIGVSKGLIVDIIPAGNSSKKQSASLIDAEGALALPGFCDGHNHPDKTFMGLPWMPHRAGPTRESRIETEKVMESELDYPTAERAGNLIERCMISGTTDMRCHIDVDPDIKLKRLEGMLEVRDRYRDRVSIEIVAFPQSGVIRSPGTLELLEAAIGLGADLIGGIDPQTIDGDPAGQLDGLFDIAERSGVGIDLHLHEPGETGLSSIREICRRTSGLGMNGKVTISHGFCLGMVDESRVKETAHKMAKAGVSLCTHGAGASAIPPILLLRDAGVAVSAGNDNIRDSWSPNSTFDMLERAMLISWRSDFRLDDHLIIACDMITEALARIRGQDPIGVAVGAPADLCFVAADGIPEAIVSRPKRKLVVKGGMIVSAQQQLRQPGG